MRAPRHQKIVIFKTSYYSFYLPVALAMYMCGIPHASANDPYALAESTDPALGANASASPAVGADAR